MARLRTELEAARKPPPASVVTDDNGPPLPPLPNPATDPDAYAAAIEARVENAALNRSEMAARKAFPDFMERRATFLRAVETNPALAAQARMQPDPWRWACEQAPNLVQFDQFREDPDAFLARKRAEWEAERAAPAPSAAPVVNPAAGLPVSLAGARSSAPRGAPTTTGDTPLAELVPRR